MKSCLMNSVPHSRPFYNKSKGEKKGGKGGETQRIGEEGKMMKQEIAYPTLCLYLKIVLSEHCKPEKLYSNTRKESEHSFQTVCKDLPICSL